MKLTSRPGAKKARIFLLGDERKGEWCFSVEKWYAFGYHDGMRVALGKIKGVAFLVWHGRHMVYHVLLGLVWAWFLRERWGEFNVRWIGAAVVGSLLPDVDHLIYFLGYGKTDVYVRQIRSLFKGRRWRDLTAFMATGHKYNTSLTYHNYYVMAALLLVGLASSLVNWEAGVILFGAMVIHYAFDVADDLLQLGAPNPNWRRWGRP